MRDKSKMKPRKKMSLADLKDLYPIYSPGKALPAKATKKGFSHKVNPTYKPPAASLTPKEWHKAQRKKREAENAKKRILAKAAK
jgi:hypothetical protein